MWMDTRGARALARRSSAAACRATRPARWPPGSVVPAGVPTPIGRRPDRAHAAPASTTSPATPRAARWYLEPVDYLSMRFTGVAAASHGVDDRGLAHRQPPPRPARRTTPTLVRRAGVEPRQAAAAGAHRHRGRRRCCRRSPRTSGSPATRWWSPACPTCTARRSARAACGDYEAHLAIGTTGWISCPVPLKKTDMLRQIATVPGLTPDRYLLGDNHETAGRVPAVVPRAAGRPDDGLDFDPGPTYDELTAAAATAPAGAGGVHLHAVAGRRALAGRRTAPPAAGSTTCRWPRPAPTWRARCWRAWPTTPAGCSRRAERFAGRRLDPLRLIGGGAQSALWCQILADVIDRTIERVADPLLTGLRGAALFAGLALGEVAWTRSGAWCRWTRPSRPTRGSATSTSGLRGVPGALQEAEADVLAAQPVRVGAALP